jgi:hypothetical protein
MDDLLKQRISRLLESLDDEKAYQVLDYAEFLTSKYAQRAEPQGLLAKMKAAEESRRPVPPPKEGESGLPPDVRTLPS